MNTRDEQIDAFLVDSERRLKEADETATREWKAKSGLWNWLRGPDKRHHRGLAVGQALEQMRLLAAEIGEPAEALPYLLLALGKLDRPITKTLGFRSETVEKAMALGKGWNPFAAIGDAAWGCPRCGGPNDRAMDEVCRLCGEPGPCIPACLMELLYPRWPDFKQAQCHAAPEPKTSGSDDRIINALAKHLGIQHAKPASTLGVLPAAPAANMADRESAAALYREIVASLDFHSLIPTGEGPPEVGPFESECDRLQQIACALLTAVKADAGRAHLIEVSLKLIADGRASFPDVVAELKHTQALDAAGTVRPEEVIQCMAHLMAAAGYLFRAQLILLDVFAPFGTPTPSRPEQLSSRVQLMTREGPFRRLQPDGVCRTEDLGLMRASVESLPVRPREDFLWTLHCATILQDQRALQMIAAMTPLRSERFLETDPKFAMIWTNYRFLVPGESYVFGGAPPVGYSVMPPESLARIRRVPLESSNHLDGNYARNALFVLPFLQQWPEDVD